MEKHKAFAFADFDTAKILQRRRFGRFKLPNADDAIILEDLIVPANADQTECEEICATVFLIKCAVRDFELQLARHVKRLSRVTLKVVTADGDVDERIVAMERGKRLMSEYGAIVEHVKALFEKLIALGNRNDKTAQKLYRMRFAENLKAARLRSKIPQKNLAAALGVGVPTVSDYERGEVAPSLRNLARLSDLLDVSTDWLLGLTP